MEGPVPPSDASETLSDMNPLQSSFEEIGAPPHLFRLWWAGVLRDGFTLTAAGAFAEFSAVAREGSCAGGGCTRGASTVHGRGEERRTVRRSGCLGVHGRGEPARAMAFRHQKPESSRCKPTSEADAELAARLPAPGDRMT